MIYSQQKPQGILFHQDFARQGDGPLYSHPSFFAGGTSLGSFVCATAQGAGSWKLEMMVLFLFGRDVVAFFLRSWRWQSSISDFLFAAICLMIVAWVWTFKMYLEFRRHWKKYVTSTAATTSNGTEKVRRWPEIKVDGCKVLLTSLLEEGYLTLIDCSTESIEVWSIITWGHPATLVRRMEMQSSELGM